MRWKRTGALVWSAVFLIAFAASSQLGVAEEGGTGPAGPAPGETEKTRGVFSAGTFTNALGMAFAHIPAGSFRMGSPGTERGREEDETLHPVMISAPFYMGTKEVTQGQWQKVMGQNPSRFHACGIDCPVEKITWGDAIEFCNRLSEIEGLDPAYRVAHGNVVWDMEANGYRLPTEAEWEYACRAGTTSAFHTGEIVRTTEALDPNLDRAGWYFANAIGTRPVGLKEANPWGLYDMHGNVCEWCWDWYGKYPDSPVKDPAGPPDGTRRAVRGGSWYSDARSCRSADRIFYEATGRNSSFGLRVCRSIKR